MAIPERYRRLFEPELEAGEQIRAVANADLWLRYRRLALTNRRLLVVERGGIRNPLGGRKTHAVPIGEIDRVDVARNPVQWTIRLHIHGGRTLGYALPAISRGTARFAEALRREVAGRALTWPRPADSSP